MSACTLSCDKGKYCVTSLSALRPPLFVSRQQAATNGNGRHRGCATIVHSFLPTAGFDLLTFLFLPFPPFCTGLVPRGMSFFMSSTPMVLLRLDDGATFSASSRRGAGATDFSFIGTKG